jgi:hypothetical protein
VGDVIGVGVEDGAGDGGGVVFCVKLAVIVLGPFTLTVVDAELELAKVIKPLLAFHWENITRIRCCA